MKNRYIVSLIVLVGLYPFMVGYSTPDPENVTILDLLLGFGSYYQVLARDCNGNPERWNTYHFNDYGISIEHRDHGLILMANGGNVRSNGPLHNERIATFDTVARQSDTYFAELGIGTYGKLGRVQAAIIGGAAYFERPVRSLTNFNKLQPFVRLTLGDEHTRTVFGVLDESALLSRGGIWRVMAERSMDSASRSWFGLGVGGDIYNGIQLIGRLQLHLIDNLTVLLSGNVGDGDPESEFGLSGGLRMRF